MANNRKRIRCAVYTRKSSDEGLEQEFNSLDAQREAGESYVNSQRHEGWILLPDYYDDGGFSGGTLERPALKQLMEDIKKGLVDIVVVYKVDRLSRSLVDFAKIVDLFDEHDVSFVSVTQNFNTTTSMGRLTLNILLSFAQFEREVIGERIRDKFAASKMKGIWMGGPPPLGYDVVDRQLVVNKKEAAMVNHIFYRFIKLRSIKKLLLELKNDGYRTKQYISQTRKPHGGKVIGKTYLYRVLRNKMYLGLMPHKGKIYQGRHKPIISDELWEDAHKILNTSPAKKTAYNRTVNKSMLRNIITCECCNSRFVPVYTTNRNKKYRYYSPHNELNQHNTNCKVGPLAAGEIESLVLEHLKQLLTSPEIITHTFEYINKNYSADIELNLIKNKFQNFEHLWSKVSSDDKQKMVEQLVHQIRVSTNNMQIQLRLEGFRTVINEYADMKG